MGTNFHGLWVIYTYLHIRGDVISWISRFSVSCSKRSALPKFVFCMSKMSICGKGLPMNTMKIEPPWILLIPQYYMFESAVFNNSKHVLIKFTSADLNKYMSMLIKATHKFQSQALSMFDLRSNLVYVYPTSVAL